MLILDTKYIYKYYIFRFMKCEFGLQYQIFIFVKFAIVNIKRC